MRRIYLISAIVVGVLLLVISFAQFGGTCTLFLVPSSPVFLVFLQVAALGAVMGGLLILFWKTPQEEAEHDPTSEGPSE